MAAELPDSSSPHPSLRRELGVFGASMMGLGAMMGTGVFVSIGVAAGVAGPTVVLAIAVAAIVALCNALSSAQLAASHPVSGGTYEYGYKYLTPSLGFSAGWMFLVAKSASAATAALGISGYLIEALGWQNVVSPVILAAGLAVAVTGLVGVGMKRSNQVNILIVTVTVVALVAFLIVALPGALSNGGENLEAIFPSSSHSGATFLQACALMFVAYTGYGRIATMGEEVKDPRKVIPRAILVAMGVAAVLYLGVGIAVVGIPGAVLHSSESAGSASLESVLRTLNRPGVGQFVAVGAVTAMLGVLLNLVLGLSRVVLAMGRRGDLPAVFSRLDATRTTPPYAVAIVGAGISLLTLLGDIKLTWSLSAFTVLIYYALTNLAALRLKGSDVIYPRFISWMGLASCLFLAFWVESSVWISGLGILVLGLVGRWVIRRWL